MKLCISHEDLPSLEDTPSLCREFTIDSINLQCYTSIYIIMDSISMIMNERNGNDTLQYVNVDFLECQCGRFMTKYIELPVTVFSISTLKVTISDKRVNNYRPPENTILMYMRHSSL